MENNLNVIKVVFVEGGLSSGKETRNSEIEHLSTIPNEGDFVEWKEKLYKVNNILHVIRDDAHVACVYLTDVKVKKVD